MAGPMNPGVEMWNGAAWIDISGDVQTVDAVTSSRGRQNESGQSDPSTCSITLDNRSKNYSPRNPNGTYYGIFKRGTLIRTFVRNGESRQRNVGGDYFSCPDSVNLSITGDIDLRSDLWLSTWRPGGSVWLGLLKTATYGIYITAAGYLSIQWWSGTVATWINSTVPVPGGQVGRKAVRVTLDVNNGAGGKTATFYYSDTETMAGTWVQYDQVTTAGTTTIDDTAGALTTLVDDDGVPAEVYEVRVYQNIGGTLRANPVFTAQSSPTTSFADAQGNTWSNGTGGAICDNKSVRFTGRINDLKIDADQSGNYIYTKVVAAGVTRRLGQGSAPTDSPLRSALPTIGAPLVGYWPLEDAKDARLPEMVIGGTARPRYIGPVKRADYNEFVAAKTAPVLSTGRIWLPVKAYANTNYFQVRCLLHLDHTIADQTVLMRIWTNSSLGWIDLIYDASKSLFFKTYTSLGVLSHTGSLFFVGDMTTDTDAVYSMQFKKNGTGVDLNHVMAAIGDNGFVGGSTSPSITLGSCTQIYINPDGADLKGTALGHVRVENVETSIFDFKQQNDAYRGEYATDRFWRHCLEAGITARVAGLSSSTQAMGYQSRSSRVSLLREAAELDGGIMFELGRSEALRFRTLDSLCGQTPAFVFDYSAKYFQEFDPTDDDQRIRNKVTVSRSGGTSATVTETYGGDGALNNDGSALSVYDPPDGVGLYDDSATLPLYSDEDADLQAGWRVNTGTVDEPRIPSFTIDLGHPDLIASPSNTRKILNLEIGDRIVIDNPPTNRLPPDDLDQIIQGVRERFDQFRHTITFNCGPNRPYRVAQQNAMPGYEARYGSLGSQLSAGVASGATSLSVAYGSGPGWTHADGDFDIMVDGERMTVTAVAGAGSPQTFTVTRSVNGIVKAQSANAKVSLADQTVFGLAGTMGSKGQSLRAGDIRMPTPVYEYGNGINSITSLGFTYLPTTPLSVTISNPNPYREMVCQVCYGGWGYISAGGNGFRVSTWLTRSLIGIGGPTPDPLGPAGWGEVIFVANTAVTQFQVCYTTKLEVSPIPYVIYQLAYRDGGAGTQTWEYATLRVIPLYYV